MRLLLIRHGQTPSNVYNLLDTGVPGPGLTDLGHEQATALPETLAGYRIDAIYASTQLRAQLTAAPLAAARGLPVQVRAGLREVGAGDLEMLGDEESIRTYQGVIHRWITGQLDVRMPSGQLGSEVLDRFDAVVEEVVQCLRRDIGENGCAVLVAHGAILRMWASVRATDLAAAEDSLGQRHGLHNTGMIVLESTAPPAAGWQVLSWAGRAIGGRILDDGDRTGPAGEDPLGSPDRVGADSVGVDGVGVDGAGVDGVGVDGAGADGVGVDGADVDVAGVHGAGVQSADVGGAREAAPGGLPDTGATPAATSR